MSQAGPVDETLPSWAAPRVSAGAGRWAVDPTEMIPAINRNHGLGLVAWAPVWFTHGT